MMWSLFQAWEAILKQGQQILIISRQLTPWKSVCGGSQWTNKEALVACNQLNYHNTTTIGK